MGIVITEVTNQDPRFYQWVGPFLGSREVHQALGGPVYDDPGKRWWVAHDDSGKVVGFCALTAHEKTAHLGSAYVVPQARSEKVYSALFQARLEEALKLGITLRASVRPTAEKVFLKYGFRVLRKSKHLTFFELVPEEST